MRGTRPQEETNLDKMLVDGIRGLLGLPPLYCGDPVGTGVERHGQTHPGWWRRDGRTTYTRSL